MEHRFLTLRSVERPLEKQLLFTCAKTVLFVSRPCCYSGITVTGLADCGSKGRRSSPALLIMMHYDPSIGLPGYATGTCSVAKWVLIVQIGSTASDRVHSQ